MEEIHDDLKFLQDRLSIDERILIVIDDLDRCEPEKAVEVLQAINLLLNFESFIIFMGIDARIITRAVENHYKGLLEPAGASGYEYLEKVVQIPFRIPEPNSNDIKRFIAEQFGDLKPPMKENSEPKNDEAPDIPSGGMQTELGDRKAQETYKSEDEVSTLRGPSVPFTYAEQKAFQDLARFLKPNPRHLKRLINVYRLVRALAAYKNQQIILNHPVATIRWLVICGQWPYTTYSMLRYFDKMIGDREENESYELPSDVDPLTFLLKEVRKDQEIFSLDRQCKLDHDPNLLSQLLQREDGRLNWEGLEVIRQYTVNFNPAIEAEFIYETKK